MPKKSEKQTYAAAGVDRDGHSDITQGLRPNLTRNDPRLLNRVGAFASLFAADFPGISDPVLVLKAEEPGSKQLLAKNFNKIDNIGFDMINHLINDIIVMGGKPLAVLDVIVVGKLVKDDINKIITAINQACVNQDCSLVGGEISEQPGVLPGEVFILSSSVVGVVSKKKIIDGARIKKGDKVIAMASNGLHTNGYSLVRKLITEKPVNSEGKSRQGEVYRCGFAAAYRLLSLFERYSRFPESARPGAYHRRRHLRQPGTDFAGGFERAGASG